MVRALILSSMLIITGCASIPQWSPNPQDCNDLEGKYEQGFDRHLVMGIQKTMARKYYFN